MNNKKKKNGGRNPQRKKHGEGGIQKYMHRGSAKKLGGGGIDLTINLYSHSTIQIVA